MIKNIKYIFFTLFLAIFTTAFGQDYRVTIKDVGIKDGLIESRVTAMHEDKKGFMWLITLHGLMRYDGHQSKSFNKSNSNLRSLSDQITVPEDAEGYLWLTKKNAPLDLFHTTTFEVIPAEEKFKADFPDGLTTSFIVSNQYGSIFFQHAETKVFYMYHPSSGVKKLPFIKNPKNILPKKETIWVSLSHYHHVEYSLKTGEQLNQFILANSPQNLRLIQNFPLEGDWFSFYDSVLKEAVIFKAVKNNIEILAKTPAEQLPSTGQLFHYHSPSQLLIAILSKDNKSKLVAFDLNGQSKYLKKVKNQTINVHSRFTYQDSQHTLWGIPQRGIRLYEIKKNDFTQYVPLKQTRGFWVNDKLLIGNRFKINLEEPNSLKEFKLTANSRVFASQADECWAINRNTLFQIDVEQEEIIKRIPLKETVRKTINKDQNLKAWSLLKDKENNWWIGTLREGVFCTTPNKDSLTFFNRYNGFEQLKSATIIHLLEDGEYIWASSTLGLFLIHKKKGVLRQYFSEALPSSSLPFNDIHLLHKDKDNNYWVATNGDGLVKFQLNEALEVINIKKYDENDGLSSSILYAIIEDEKERLWISTFNGIICFDKKTETFQRFLEEDGVTQLEFNRISFAKGQDGRIYFGSLKGIFGFQPNDVVKPIFYNQPISITNCSVYRGKKSKTIDLTEQVQRTKKILIKSTDRLFRLNVTTTDYFNAQKISYAYKIEGLFEEFQQINGNTIEIGDLPYGKYKLIVRGTGTNGRFSKEKLILDLVVQRPFYLRWWFILLMIIIIILSTLQFYSWRVQQLQDRKKELELMVKERTTQIEQQAIQLKELDKIKSKFFANISHELRTPLTLILAPMESISKSNELSNKNFTYFQMMEQNGKKLLKRINELLDLSRLDANKLEVNEVPVFLYPFFKILLSTFESTAHLKNIELLFDFQLNEHIQAKLDDDKVEKIITNLLSNALKFTPKQGKIELTVSKTTNKLNISVRDTGIGILPNDLVKIFDRFYQSKDVSLKGLNQGTGIGLSLCRELAKVLNGKVWATSEIGKGSVFYLELPLLETFVQKEVEETQEILLTPIIEPTLPSSLAKSFRPNILVVEDNADLRHYLTLILEKNFNVTAVENGELALEYLEQSTPHLIVSDIMMPVMDGMEMLTKIKSSDHYRHIPIVMLTARQSSEVKIEALRIGVDDYLTKPFKEEELKARVTNLIKNSHNRLILSKETNIDKRSKAISKITKADYEWLEKIEKIILNSFENPNFKLNDLTISIPLSYSRIQQKS